LKLKYAVLACALLTLGCGTSTSNLPTQESNSLFSQMTSVPPLANESPTSAASLHTSPTSQSSLFSDLGTLLFRDDFDGSLDSGWEWVREDDGSWSLTAAPGFMQINARSGDVNKETITNLLLRSIPSGTIQIETKITFQPVANFQFAGIIMYESPSNFVQAGRAYCEGENPRCVSDGFYMDYYEGGSFVVPNYAGPFSENDTVYLRLIRRENTYTLQTSTDGETWTLRGTTTSNMNPLQIGLVAGQNTSSVVPAVFDYFEVKSLP